MISLNQNQKFQRKVVSRHTFLLILRTALECHCYRFARQAANTWLATYPGDMGVNLLCAKALSGEGNYSQASEILSGLCKLDPEFLEAYTTLATIIKNRDSEPFITTTACAYILGNELRTDITIPDWSIVLMSARQALMNGSLNEAEELINQVIGLNLDLSLPGVLHLWVNSERRDVMTVHNLANIYHTRWPDCLQFTLWLAEAQLKLGDETRAVNLLHECVAKDIIAQVPSRLWGSDFRYRPLWPESLEIEFDMLIPAEVSGLLGWNTLPAGDISSVTRLEDSQEAVQIFEVQIHDNSEDLEDFEKQPVKDISDEGKVNGVGDQIIKTSVQKDVHDQQATEKKDKGLRSIEEAFAWLAKEWKRPVIGRSDGRFPMYVIFTNRFGLEKKYGKQTFDILDTEMKRLVEILRQRPGWGALIYYPDDPECTSKYDLSAVESIDPWKLKLSLADLDKALAKKGAMIGALLIVGDPDVVPFHHLPNPTDDIDLDVPSDNPYATLDANYFITEWPVGRLPGEDGPDAGLLLKQLRSVIQYHVELNRSIPWWKRIYIPFDWGKRLIELLDFRPVSTKSTSFGYSAAVWKRSSQAVFRLVGADQDMLISPPEYSGSFEPQKLIETSLGYYNLHGLADTAEWYGQRDLTESSSTGPDYPVALRPNDLKKNGKAPKIVFCEACYGGHISKKTEERSLALRFASIGTQAIIGSTGIAYGSVTTPLIGADLLGYLFWKHLQAGEVAGVALMKAKMELVKQMNKQQGFLDGEDQKTLISFVLYGDPLAGGDSIKKHPKGVMRLRTRPSIKTICDRQNGEQLIPKWVSNDVINEVKQIVENYLPGLDDAEILITKEHLSCNGVHHRCPTSELGSKVQHTKKTDRVVITVSKQVSFNQHIHHHYARATLDSDGKLVKLAISR